MTNIRATCPKCKCEFDMVKEKRESFNCPICNVVLVRKEALLKGEPVKIDGRHTT